MPKNNCRGLFHVEGEGTALIGSGKLCGIDLSRKYQRSARALKSMPIVGHEFDAYFHDKIACLAYSHLVSAPFFLSVVMVCVTMNTLPIYQKNYLRQTIKHIHSQSHAFHPTRRDTGVSVTKNRKLSMQVAKNALRSARLACVSDFSICSKRKRE